MKRKTIVLLVLFFNLVPIFAQGSYPLKKEINVYLVKNSIDKRMTEALAGIKPDSMEYNKKGYVAYEKKDWVKALDYFNKAIKIDEKNPFAHYNLACTLSLKFGAAASKETLNEIFDHLKKAADFDVSFCIQLFVDSDLDAIRQTGYENEIYTPGDIMPATYENYWKNGSITFRSVWDSSTDLRGGPDNESGEVYETEVSKPELPPAKPYPPDGFYCYIGDHMIEYFPALTTWTGGMDQENVFYFY